MRRWITVAAIALVLAPPGWSQLKTRPERPVTLPDGMKDEDEDFLVDNDYVFNPVQAEHELKVGRFYMKKGSPRAALGRFQEAAKWNPTYAEAYYWAGQANERLDQHREALASYQRYLELEPDGKESKRVEETISQLERRIETLPLAAGPESQPTETANKSKIPNSEPQP